MYWVRMQRVQAATRTRAPLMVIVVLCTLGSHRVGVRRFEWLTFRPNRPIFPQT